MTRLGALVTAGLTFGFFGCGGGTAATSSESETLGQSASAIAASDFCQVQLTPGVVGGGPIETGLCASDNSAVAACSLQVSPQCVRGRRASTSRLDGCNVAVDNVVCSAPPPPTNHCQVELTPNLGGGPIETGLCSVEADPTAKACALTAAPQCVKGRRASTSSINGCGQPIDD